MKVLVCTAGKHGATAQIGGAIAEALSGNGVPADVRSPEQVTDLEGYDALVLGSAVYMGRWLRSARDLVDRVSGQLDGRPVWLFSSGPVGDSGRGGSKSPVDVAAIEKATEAREHHVFGGKLERAQVGFLERAIMTAMHAADRDDRDWDEIAAWGEHVAGQLRPSGQPSAEADDTR